MWKYWRGHFTLSSNTTNYSVLTLPCLVRLHLATSNLEARLEDVCVLWRQWRRLFASVHAVPPAFPLSPLEDVQTSQAPSPLLPPSSQVSYLAVQVSRLFQVSHRLPNLTKRFIHGRSSLCDVPDWLPDGELDPLHWGVGEAGVLREVVQVRLVPHNLHRLHPRRAGVCAFQVVVVLIEPPRLGPPLHLPLPVAASVPWRRFRSLPCLKELDDLVDTINHIS